MTALTPCPYYTASIAIARNSGAQPEILDRAGALLLPAEIGIVAALDPMGEGTEMRAVALWDAHHLADDLEREL